MSDSAMQSQETRIQLPIGHHGAAEMRQIFAASHPPRKLGEYCRTETECPVKVSVGCRRLACVRFPPIDEENLSGGCSVRRTLIRVLLDPSFDQPNDEVFVHMAREPVLHIVRVDDLTRIGDP